MIQDVLDVKGVAASQFISYDSLEVNI